MTGAAAAQTAQQPGAPQNTTQQPTAQQPQPPVAELPPVTVIGTTPLLGSGVDRDTVPAETNVLKGDDLTRAVPPCQIPFGRCMNRSAASTWNRHRAIPIGRSWSI